MARRLELTHARSSRGRAARLSAVAASGAMILATLVAPTTATAGPDDAPTPVAGGGLPDTVTEAELPFATAADAGTGTGTAVVGLIVEHTGAPASISGATDAIEGLGLSSELTSVDDGTSVVSFDSITGVAEAEEAAAAIEAVPGVTSVDLNVLHTPQAAPPGGTPADAYFGYLHGIWDQRDSISFTYGGTPATYSLPAGGYGTKAPALWRLTKGSSKVTVAVIDTGRTAHPDLDANTVAGYDLISSGTVIDPRDGNGRDADPSDEGDWQSGYNECYLGSGPTYSSWHGTHVAGTIAALADAQGVVGNAPGVRVQHVRVLGKCGGTTKDIADGITWASGGKVKGTSKNKTPAKVLNLSLGGKIACQPVMQKAINGARKRGSVVIVAAGNDSMDARNSQPANCKNVITVGAAGFLGTRTPYSNYGPAVDLSAPGGDLSWGLDSDGYASTGILSTLNMGETTPGEPYWAWYEGTSMATPGVAGVAALIASLRPKLSAKQLEKAIRASVSKFPKQDVFGSYSCVKNKVCGKGLLDATRSATAWYAKPKVTRAQVGKKAKVSTPIVATNGTFTYQWLRGGKKIKGATKKTYTVKKGDLGKKLSVRVTASVAGFPGSKATSAKVKVTKHQPTVTVKLAKKKVSKKAKAKVTIIVKLGAITKKPTGKITLTYGSKSRTYTLKAAKKGKLTVRLPQLGKGKYRIKAKYTPAKKFAKVATSGTSPKVTLKVR